MIWDTVVAGGGVFGAWIAHALAACGERVLLVDCYGPGNSRGSSGGESRIIRMGYGADEIYTQMAKRSLGLWLELFGRTRQPLFCCTGVLWLAAEGDARMSATAEVLARNGVPFELLEAAELRRRYPRLAIEDSAAGLLEPDSGAILARRAVQAVVDDGRRLGVSYRCARIETPGSTTGAVRTSDGDTLRAGRFVFACGPWLDKLFPDVLGGRIFPTRQEVFFFGVPSGDQAYAPGAMPVWLNPGGFYGFPDLESRGLKIANDKHGAVIDPDREDRIVSAEQVQSFRAEVGRLFPGLRDAPVLETRVCQYENTSNGDFLIDRHPTREDIWFAGGGSGHGFKHGPAVGEYVAALINGRITPEKRFSLAGKDLVKQRAVY